MAIIKCKMCGGELNIVDSSFVAECEYCGTKQTIPALDDDKKLKMFERANKLRATCEFDKASGIYESIVEDYPEEAEAYWGLILCKYGIEYVDDPTTGNKIPTCHRSSFDSVMDDPNFDMVMENADSIAVDVYRNEAKQIEEIRKGIIQVSNQEQPYDIFICYKETDENGERTVDSVIAQDVYKELTREGYRVFFSRITLEDKLGQEYEPYIFAALNSAKVMLAFGTDYKYYNAVWVKNEWSRYLKLIAAGQNKTLIPCYKGIDAYDMPKEFARLQAQDMGKVGAIQDLLRGLEKIFGRDTKPQTQSTINGVINESTYITRGMMCLEEKSWDKAIEYFEQAMNVNESSGEAYFGLYLAEKQLESISDIRSIAESKFALAKPEVRKLNIDKKQREWNVFVAEKEVPGYLENKDISALFSCATEYKVLSREYKNIEAEIHRQIENKVLDKALGLLPEDKGQQLQADIDEIYAYLKDRVKMAEQDEADAEKIVLDKVEIALSDAKKKATQLYEEASQRREEDHKKCCEEKERYVQAKDYDRLLQVAEKLKKFGKYKDSDRTAEYCINMVNSKKKAAKRKKLAIIGSVAVVLAIVITVFVVLLNTKILPDKKYNEAMKLIESGNYEEGYVLLRELGDYKGAEAQINDIQYDRAVKLLEEDKYEEGLQLVEGLNDSDLVSQFKYDSAIRMLELEDYSDAYKLLEELGAYEDAEEILNESRYNRALEKIANNNASEGIAMLEKLGDYKDSKEMIKKAYYDLGIKCSTTGYNSTELFYYYDAILYFENAGDYLDAKDKIEETRCEWISDYVENSKATYAEYGWYDYLSDDEYEVIMEIDLNKYPEYQDEMDFIIETQKERPY